MCFDMSTSLVFRRRCCARCGESPLSRPGPGGDWPSQGALERPPDPPGSPSAALDPLALMPKREQGAQHQHRRLVRGEVLGEDPEAMGLGEGLPHERLRAPPELGHAGDALRGSRCASCSDATRRATPGFGG